jgi:hypothetical protein
MFEWLLKMSEYPYELWTYLSIIMVVYMWFRVEKFGMKIERLEDEIDLLSKQVIIRKEE